MIRVFLSEVMGYIGLFLFMCEVKDISEADMYEIINERNQFYVKLHQIQLWECCNGLIFSNGCWTIASTVRQPSLKTVTLEEDHGTIACNFRKYLIT